MSKKEFKYADILGLLDRIDYTFDEWLEILVDDMMHSLNVVYKQNGLPASECSYFILKSQLETLLTERNIDDIEEVMVKSENRGPYGDDPDTRRELAECHAQFLERIYHEIYKDDPTFRPELVKTPIEELLKMHF